MIRTIAFASTIASLGVLFGTPGAAIAQQHPEGMLSSMPEPTSQFQPIDHPLWLKAAVTAGGLGLMGLELWWFLGSKPKSSS
jgi:plastocyanin domain-containing protein